MVAQSTATGSCESGSDLLRPDLQRLAKRVAAQSSATDRRLLAELYRKHGDPTRYTAELARAFAAEFLTLNYDMYLATLAAAGLDDPKSVLDVGAGSGAFSAAALSWLGAVGTAPERLVLLDRSRRSSTSRGAFSCLQIPEPSLSPGRGGSSCCRAVPGGGRTRRSPQVGRRG